MADCIGQDPGGYCIDEIPVVDLADIDLGYLRMLQHRDSLFGMQGYLQGPGQIVDRPQGDKAEADRRIAMFPWFYFNDGLMGATGSIIANGFLVKKVVFRVSLLPVIQLTSALMVNAFFLCVLFVMPMKLSMCWIILRIRMFMT